MIFRIQTLKDIRSYFKNELMDLYPEPEIAAITTHILKTRFGIDRLQILRDPDQIVSSHIAEKVIEICNELKTGKPLQYVLGETEFYNCTIKVNNQTLIPRPETEELIDLIIKDNPDFRERILDIGTGSGCIAIALKKNLPGALVTGIDISAGAIEMAKSNAVINNVAVSFLIEDIFQSGKELIPGTDIIVSNPPYVLESEIEYMRPNVLDFEPHNALFVPDEEPLIFYSAIINVAKKILSQDGKIYFEINEKKGDEIRILLELAGYKNVKIIKDINGKDRFVKGTLNG
jgi:release factor glutamine methyltransferase